MPELPNQKTSFYQLTRRECRNWYREACQKVYPDKWQDMMKEYGQAVADEPDGLDGVHIQLSCLLSAHFGWY